MRDIAQTLGDMPRATLASPWPLFGSPLAFLIGFVLFTVFGFVLGALYGFTWGFWSKKLH